MTINTTYIIIIASQTHIIFRKENDNIMIDKIIQILADAVSLDESEITPDMSISEDLGIDSLDLVDIAMALEDEFDIMVSDDELASLKTVRDIVSYISELTDEY